MSLTESLSHSLPQRPYDPKYITKRAYFRCTVFQSPHYLSFFRTDPNGISPIPTQGDARNQLEGEEEGSEVET